MKFSTTLKRHILIINLDFKFSKMLFALILLMVPFFNNTVIAQTVAEVTKDNELWQIAPEAYKGMSTMSDAFDAFNKVHDAMKSIEAGNRPDIEKLEADDWKTLVDACSEATYDIKKATYATDFNAGPFTLAAEQFKCENKTWIISILNGYKDKLAVSTFYGKKDIAKVDKSIEHAEKLHIMVKECIKMYEKVIALPIYQEIFQWDWYALETAVKPAVAEYKNELKKYRDKYQKEVDAADRHLGVLQSNINLIQDCDKPKLEPKPKPEPKPIVAVYDFYSGTFGTKKFELKVKRLDTYYMSDGYVRKYGPAGYSEWKIFSFIENGNNVELYTTLTFSDGTSDRERLKGNFSADKTKLTLKYVSPKYSAVVQLNKQ
jgi:hypothetical protein